ncbi:hypothetical protein HK102_009724, partial [Quaeritorhiza haematococci]
MTPDPSWSQRLYRIAKGVLDDRGRGNGVSAKDYEDAQTLLWNAGYGIVPNLALQARFAFIMTMHECLEHDARLLLSKNMRVQDLVDPAKYLDHFVRYFKDGLGMLREKL